MVDKIVDISILCRLFSALMSRDGNSQLQSSIGSSAPQRWKTGRGRATNPHWYDYIFKEKWGRLQGKLTAGIRRVIYLEPYPKSRRAEMLHKEEIEQDSMAGL